MTQTYAARPRVGNIWPLGPDTEKAIFSLPGGWTLLHGKGAARTSIEIHDTRGDLIGLVASTRLPVASVDAAWRGLERTAAGSSWWWALAIGHGWSTAAGTVTFTRRLPRSRVHRRVITPVMVDGLWVAAAVGRYATVTLRQGDNEVVRRLQPAHDSWRSTFTAAKVDDASKEKGMPDVTNWNTRIVEEFRANEGRVGGNFEGAPMVLVHHHGRKTGRAYVNPLMYLADETDDNVIYVFATRGGDTSNPDWYYNLTSAAVTSIERGKESYRVTVRDLTGDERDRVYVEQARRYPGFADYARQTEGIRTIPVLELRRTP